MTIKLAFVLRAALVMMTLVLGGRTLPAEELFAGNEAALLETLRTGTPAEKAIACKKLAVLGSKDAVPLLAPLLADEQLSSWARIALEAIPDSSADEALRKAAANPHGKQVVGVINSIGVRRDPAAVSVLDYALLSGSKGGDSEVAEAAAVALGRIGGEAAIESLRSQLNVAKPTIRSAVAEGCILCAERLLAEGNTKEAAALYDEVRGAELPQQRKLEAIRGAILARGADGAPLLLEQLRSDDKKLFQLGLIAARELRGAGVAEALMAEAGKVEPARSAFIIVALADRPEAAATPEILQAAAKGDRSLKLAVLRLIARSGGAANVDHMLAATIDQDAEVAAAALNTLAELPGDEIDSHLQSLLPAADGKQLVALLELVGKRRIEATAELTKSLEHADATVRAAALKALGETVSANDLPMLVQQALRAKETADADAAWAALLAASVRMPDRDACAGQLAAAMEEAPTAAQGKLVEILGTVGGPTALAALASSLSAENADDAVLDAGTRALGQWMEIDAAPVLLDLAKNAKGEKYQVRSLRAYLRIARQFRMDDKTRAEMCRQALLAAQRPEEQQLVLEVLERYPSAETLDVAKEAANRPELKAAAAKVATSIEKKSGGN